MVVQKAIDNLKERPKDERTTVAGGVAIAVVIALLVGWGFLFLRKIQREGPSYDFGPQGIQDFGWDQLKAAGGGVTSKNYDPQSELRTLRSTGASSGEAPGVNYGQEDLFKVPSVGDGGE